MGGKVGALSGGQSGPRLWKRLKLGLLRQHKWDTTVIQARNPTRGIPLYFCCQNVEVKHFYRMGPFVSFLKRQNPESHKACVFCPNARVHKGIPLVFCPQGKLWSLYQGISVVICPKGKPHNFKGVPLSLALYHFPQAVPPT